MGNTTIELLLANAKKSIRDNSLSSFPSLNLIASSKKETMDKKILFELLFMIERAFSDIFYYLLRTRLKRVYQGESPLHIVF